MTFDEYGTDGRARYAEFAGAIRQILNAAVRGKEIIPYAITDRAKDVDSLAKKLASRGIEPGDAIDEQIKDLAGARIVFLTNTQIDVFNHAGILHENFEVLDVNVHHPIPGTETETRLFNSTNYFVALTSERLALPEYKPFEGMRAEIQVQTLLNHAWAEMGHDTIYKQPTLEHVGQRRLAAINERMEKVMRNHLLPAGHDFDKIARDFHQLLKADQSFAGALKTLAKSDDNEALSSAIGTLDDLVFPHMDDPLAEFLKIVPLLVEVVERTRGTPAGEIETVFGSYPGKAGEDVALKVSRLFDDFRYADPEATFTTLMRVYSGAATEKERKVWVDVANQFSSHNLNVWKKYGPAIPELILQGLGRLSKDEAIAGRGILTVMLGNILSSEVAGTSQTSMTVTMHQGSVPAHDEVAKLRGEAMGHLEQFLDDATEDSVRELVLDAYRKAGQPPFRGGKDDLLIMIMTDAGRVMKGQRQRAEQWGLELRRKCEVAALHCYHCFESLPPYLADNPSAVAAHKGLAAEIAALREALNADIEFVRYKTLVGHDSVRPDAWEGQRFDPQATKEWREASFKDIVADISAGPSPEWIDRTRAYIEESKSGGDRLWPMAECFQLLGETDPKVARTFLEAMDELLSPLLRALLLGIDRAGDRDTIQRYTARWLGQGRFLGIMGDYLRWQEPFAVDMLENLTLRSIELGDELGVLASIDAAAHRYEKEADRRLIERISMPAIGFLTDARANRGILYCGGLLKGSLVRALDDNQTQRLLDSFVDVPEIDYPADALLAIIAETRPGTVLDFFGARTNRQGENSGRRFDPIPFSQYSLNEPLSAHPRLMIAAVRRWYEQEPLYHEFRGGRLLHNVFPTLEQISEPLTEMVKAGDANDIKFVLATLIAYDGAEEIYPICMEAVNALPAGDSLLQQVIRALGEKGVLTGEFGYVEAEAIQRARLDRYRDDPRLKVQEFVKDLQRRIDQSMAWEQRRAEREVEQRKRDWNED